MSTLPEQARLSRRAWQEAYEWVNYMEQKKQIEMAPSSPSPEEKKKEDLEKLIPQVVKDKNLMKAFGIESAEEFFKWGGSPDGGQYG